MPFPEKIRLWHLRRAGNGDAAKATCEYMIYNEVGGWKRCGSNYRLQVHHLEPESVIIERGGNPDEAPGIVLCRKHHVGY